MGCDLTILLDRRKSQFDLNELIHQLGETTYCEYLSFPGVPKWATPSYVDTRVEIIASDRRCEIRIEAIFATISTDTGVLEFLSDLEYQGRIIGVADTVAYSLASKWAVFMPDDVFPFQDLRENVVAGSMAVESLVKEIVRIGKCVGIGSGMGVSIKVPDDCFEGGKAFTKSYPDASK